jgi:hypothetical protein
VHRADRGRHQTLGTTWHQINNPMARMQPTAATINCGPPSQPSSRCSRASANHAAPNLSVAVALRCIQLGRTHFIAVKMGACIDQCLNVVWQAGRRSQEERGIA